MSRRMSDAGQQRSAQRLGVDVATVKAVVSVETDGAGFLPDGRPKILFERHIFARLTQDRFSASHPDLSASAPGGYHGGAAEYLRLYRALQLDGEAAVQSASYGAPQIMGFNWKACGEKSLYGFLFAMHDNEDAQLALFTEFVLSQGLAGALRRKDWAGFARGYNGPAFKRNEYDTKLAAAYAALGRA
jgi:hypothetical protein